MTETDAPAGVRVTLTLEQILALIPDDYLDCRLFQHAWRPYDVLRPSRRVLRQELLCGRCETMKHLDISEDDGTLLRTGYSYPRGYLIAGAGRLGRAGRGQLWLRKLTQELEEGIHP